MNDIALEAFLPDAELRKLNKKLAKLGDGGGTPHVRALKRATFRLLELVRRGVTQGGVDPDTGKTGYWPDTVLGNPPMQDTGNFLASINARVEGSGASAEGVVGTNLDYIRYHEQPGNNAGYIEYKPTAKQRWYLFFKYGWRIKAGTLIRIPQRRTFVTPAPWIDEVQRVYRDELLDAAFGGK